MSSVSKSEDLSRRSRFERWEPEARRILLIASVYALPMIVLTRPVLDPDLWWHLRTGEWILEHGAVPRTDPFSSYGEGRPWQAYSWLFEIFAARLHSAFGLRGIILLRFLLIYPFLLACRAHIVRRIPRFDVGLILHATVTTALAGFDSERPWHFSILFTFATLAAIESIRRDEVAVFLLLLPVLYVVWANTHVQFVLGLGFLGLAILGEAVEGVRCSPEGTRRRIARLTLLFTACASATVINPYGIEIYRTILTYTRHTSVYSLIGELKAPPFRTLGDWLILGLGGSAVYVLGLRRERSPYRYFMVAAAFYLGMRSARDAWVIVLVSLTILVDQRENPEVSPTERFPMTSARRLAAALLWLAIVAGAFLRHPPTNERMRRSIAERYPVEAASFVARNYPDVPIYNGVDLGGFLIWSLPGNKVGIDGRTNLHGDERIMRNARIWEGSAIRKTDPEFQAALLILVERDAALTEILRLDPSYAIVHEDDFAVVFRPRSKK